MYEKLIWDALITFLKNPYGAAVMMGHLEAESNLSPTNLENSYERKLGLTDAQCFVFLRFSGFVVDPVKLPDSLVRQGNLPCLTELTGSPVAVLHHLQKALLSHLPDVRDLLHLVVPSAAEPPVGANLNPLGRAGLDFRVDAGCIASCYRVIQLGFVKLKCTNAISCRQSF